MSSLIVEVCEVKEIKPHPNADRMEIAVVKGWECCVKKGTFKSGDKVVYFPVDTILPESVSEEFGVTKYLSKGRVRAARLRGIPSYGLVMPCTKDIFDAGVKEYEPDPSLQGKPDLIPVGTNVVDVFGCIKWEQPEENVNSIRHGKTTKEHPLFKRYTDIENIKNFPGVFKEGEEVVLTEKIHGTNSRVGLIDGKFVAGSHKTQRNKPGTGIPIKTRARNWFYAIRRFIKTGSWKSPSHHASGDDTYWMPLRNENIRSMLMEIYQFYTKPSQIILFGEIFGKGVQDLHYGRQGEIDYRAFDLYVGGKWLDYDDFVNWCNKFDVKTVPVLYKGPWSDSLIEEYSSGNSIESDIEQIREGFVVRPIKEGRYHKGRKILKSISFEYLDRKKGTEFH